MSTSFEAESHKSPEELEQEIDAKRASISNIVDSLESRFTPGQLFDQALAYTKGGGGEFFQNLGTTLKNNPVPTVLTGIGLTWLALNQNKPFPGYTVSSGSTGPGLGDKLSNVASQVAGAFGQVSDRVHSATSAVTDKAHALTDKAYALKDKASGMHHSASDSLGSSAEHARQMAYDANAQLHAQGAQLKDQFSTLMKEQPLMLAAIGIALGAALGAALPSTRKEDELMGSTKEKLTSTLKSKGQEAYAGVKETVKQTAEDVKQSAAAKDSEKSKGTPASGTDISNGTVSDTGVGIGIGSTDTGGTSGTTTGLPPKPIV